MDKNLLTVTVKACVDDVKGLVEQLKRLQTYKLFEGDDMTLVDINDVIEIFTNHIKAERMTDDDTVHWIPCSEKYPESGMTRAQRLELLKQIEKDIHVCSLESTFLDDAKSCAIHSAIEELEQETVLDKIKSIVAEWKMDTWTDNLSHECMLKIAEIIDKAESEDKG